MQPPRETDILDACRQGDRAAFNLLVRKYQDRVFQVVHRMVADQDDARDIAQEVFIKAYEKVAEFRGDAQVFTWLYRIAVNLSLNHIRKGRLRTFFSMSDDHHQIQDTSPSPSVSFEQEELRRLVRDGVDHLPEKQKAVFILRYYEELSYDEIATILKTSVGGLKANYHHATKKIEEYVKTRM
ncbi:MAG: sigma-70 family RNA polymerase sigma factor [Bacteroidetes bacterium]|nr:sigma-70 family RNA polymerase sigma factor [Bacteroidota bacterium]